MTQATVHCGFLPLVDCAPLVVAREIGFAAEEGLALVLHREPSWSAARDRLALGALDVAHMLAPVPIAMSMGLGGLPMRIDVPMVLSVNGSVVGVSRPLALRMRDAGMPRERLDAHRIGAALAAAADRPLRIGIPFLFSMHAELLTYWLGGLGIDGALSLRTVPPQRMADAMAEGEIDAFCVGEPWGSIAVERGVAEIVLPACAIWQSAPEKVLAARHDWIAANPETVARLIRAFWAAARWLADDANRLTASELLARPEYVDVAPDILERALTGRLVVAPSGEACTVPRFLRFFDEAATFPWRSQAVWIAARLAARTGLDPAAAAAAARACFRPDLYRAALGPRGADLPGASEKLEGALAVATAVASTNGDMLLGPDAFFDGQVFDPSPP